MRVGFYGGISDFLRWNIKHWIFPCSFSPLHEFTSRRKLAVCKPESELLAESNHPGSLISIFQPPESWENEFLLFKLPSLCSFVMALWTNTSHLTPLSPTPHSIFQISCWLLLQNISNIYSSFYNLHCYHPDLSSHLSLLDSCNSSLTDLPAFNLKTFSSFNTAVRISL